jgi:hypothetical protein
MSSFWMFIAMSSGKVKGSEFAAFCFNVTIAVHILSPSLVEMLL